VVLVAPAKPADVEVVAVLLEEMDTFYGVTEFDPLAQRVAQIQGALFGSVPGAQLLLAWDGSQLVGLATYSFLWPAAGVTRSLYLKELYVAKTHRRAGIGSLLMQSVFAIAAQHECSRVEWMTDEDNPGAQAFYEALGAERHATKIFYRVDGGGLPVIGN
jgi:ribosomal protein S18 acetylase RimI-like enzyme